MLRPYQAADKPNFNANIPEFLNKNEIHNFEKDLGQKAETYLTIEVDHTIVGGTGYCMNETDCSSHITRIVFDPTYASQWLGR